MTEKQFEELCRNHDLTFEYSDDGYVWRCGHNSRAKILAIAKTLDREMVKRVWNKVVDVKLAEFARKDFYWRDTWLNEK